MVPMELTVSNMGMFAARALAEGGPASVHGVTSRGCFLLVRSRWVLFLTPEAERGPLTLNLSGAGAVLREIQTGVAVELQEKGLKFRSPEIYLDLGKASLWEPPERPARWLSPKVRRKRQEEIGELLTRQPVPSGSTALILTLLGVPVGRKLPDASVFSSEQVETLRVTMKTREIRRLLPALEWFLGRGPGLTPAGDDLVAGLLLALNRWGDVLNPGLDLPELSHGLLPLAYRKTSTLAANLIECASAGQADERLLNALDGMMAGKPDPTECAAQLLDFGGSSGCDAFLGMLLAER
jgi:hypothetical protein